MKTLHFLFSLLFLLALPKAGSAQLTEDDVVLFKANPKQLQVKLFWKNEKGNIYGSLAALKNDLESQNKRLQFAMNGGMYDTERTPQGLFIEQGVTKNEVNLKQSDFGNFYLQPNGVFLIRKDGHAEVTGTSDLTDMNTINYATQSGPMLLIDGAYHPALRKGSTNLHVRNAVGILPSGEILFVMSKAKVNFYDLATFFLERGCQNALYLDGFVSRCYAPSNDWKQLDGKFGVIIGIVE